MAPENSPLVSVVMGVYNGATRLDETIQSVLVQKLEDFEFIIVDDGSTDGSAELLATCAASDSRIRVLRKANAGLTLALIDGCNASRGRFIARIDVGDTMAPQRLALQSDVLQRFPRCSFVSSRVAVLGPCWESLWVAAGVPEAAEPLDICSSQSDEGLAGDIPHHGSVMFRRSAYHAVGGYRAQFYYGQDWDLWYRLAEQGEYLALPDVLYQARLFPDAISMSHSRRQQAIAECSLGAHLARKAGQPERPWLEKAQTIRPGGSGQSARARTNGNYFIGEALRRQGNRECRQYFLAAIESNPLDGRPLLRLLQTVGM